MKALLGLLLLLIAGCASNNSAPATSPDYEQWPLSKLLAEYEAKGESAVAMHIYRRLESRPGAPPELVDLPLDEGGWNTPEVRACYVKSLPDDELANRNSAHPTGACWRIGRYVWVRDVVVYRKYLSGYGSSTGPTVTTVEYRLELVGSFLIHLGDDGPRIIATDTHGLICAFPATRKSD